MNYTRHLLGNKNSFEVIQECYPELYSLINSVKDYDSQSSGISVSGPHVTIKRGEKYVHIKWSCATYTLSTQDSDELVTSDWHQAQKYIVVALTGGPLQLL